MSIICSQTFLLPCEYLMIISHVLLSLYILKGNFIFFFRPESYFPMFLCLGDWWERRFSGLVRY